MILPGAPEMSRNVKGINWMQRVRKIIPGFGGLLVAVIASGWLVSQANAALTPLTYTKYLKHQVEYVSAGGAVTHHHRWYSGRKDDLIGASWRLEYTADFANVNNDMWYYLQETWGPSSWRGDTNYSPWLSYSAIRGYPHHTMVEFGVRTEECLPGAACNQEFAVAGRHWMYKN